MSSKSPIGNLPLNIVKGKQYLTQTNISYFRTFEKCGYVFDTGQSESNSTYNSIINNTSTEKYCVFNYNFPTVKIYKCNIINNSVTDKVIYNSYCKLLTVEECNIIDNIGTFAFYIEYFGKTEVINCFLRNNDKTSGNFLFNNTYDKEINLELKHYWTELCQAKQKYPFLDPDNILRIRGFRHRR